MPLAKKGWLFKELTEGCWMLTAGCGMSSRLVTDPSLSDRYPTTIGRHSTTGTSSGLVESADGVTVSWPRPKIKNYHQFGKKRFWKKRLWKQSDYEKSDFNSKNIYQVVAKGILDPVEVIPSVDHSLLSVLVRPKCWIEKLKICFFGFWVIKKFLSQISSRDIGQLQTW